MIKRGSASLRRDGAARAALSLEASLARARHAEGSDRAVYLASDCPGS
jgi:hypothetical protein